MKKFRVFFFALALLSAPEAMSQKESNIWYFGSYAGLDFNQDTLVALQNGALWDNDNSSTICDTSGRLLFYTNSDTVWNRQHQVMMNGTGLAGSITSGQCAVIVLQPGSSMYYIFTNAQFNSSQGLSYSIVDMSLNNGLGAVVLKNYQLFEFTTEKLDAVYNPVDDSYWIITHPFESRYFYVYKLTAGGLLPPVVSDAGAFYSGGDPSGYDAIGQMTVSPDGKLIASGVLSSGYIELCDFERSTGKISNSRIIPDFPNAWGIAFSPDSKMLYATRWWSDSVFQFSLYDNTTSEILLTKRLIGHATASNSYNYQAGYMQLGPDGRIYITRYQTHYLAVINAPDNPGSECDFVNNGVFLGAKFSTAGLSRVPVRTSYPAGVANELLRETAVKVFPNPSNGNFRVGSSRLKPGEEVELEITDCLGKVVARKWFKYLDSQMLSFPELKPGIYTMKIRSGQNRLISKVWISR